MDAIMRRGRSFFVGPAVSRGKCQERRRWWNWLWQIVLKGNTEPVELLMVCSLMLQGGVLLLTGGDSNILGEPRMFGVFYVVLAMIGIVGLARRNYQLRAAFGFLGFALRFYVAFKFFAYNPADVQWIIYANFTFVYAWISLRTVCRKAHLHPHLFLKKCD